MIFIGLLTDRQKRAGYFITQDEDFIFLWHGKNTDKPECVGTFLFQLATVTEIRAMAEVDMNERIK